MKKILLAAAILCGMAISVQAQDWPQWRGANRTGVSTEKGLNLSWAAKKPTVAWTFREAGLGYSSPSIAGGVLYCQGATDSKGFAFAVDVKTGALKWKQELGDEAVADRGNCPRGSVTVAGDKLYLIRGIGQIHCLEAASGKIIWTKDFTSDFNGKMMSRWGFCESPLVDGNLVICTPGGADGTMVALDKNTGALVWRTKDWTDDAGYSSPIVAEVDGVRMYIQQAAKGVAGVSVDGKVLWKYVIPNYKTGVIPTPIFENNVVYVTSGYNAGCNSFRLSKVGNEIKADSIYFNKNMINQHGGVVLMNGYIYGHSDNAGWVCQNLKTGERTWAKRSKPGEGAVRGSVVGVDGHFIALDEASGTLSVAVASPEGWKEVSRMDFPERTALQTQDNKVWAHPVIAGGKLYLRDQDLIICVDLK
ncbi:MAG: PQQ-like beta-propeller repeat protein [Prevotellaceae bacterium]|jgi:outer membrane protein assembly factor BamB|nr:PQQ-like beta-propeller repeat protein [Prevotellaceae bacterium]